MPSMFMSLAYMSPLVSAMEFATSDDEPPLELPALLFEPESEVAVFVPAVGSTVAAGCEDFVSLVLGSTVAVGCEGLVSVVLGRTVVDGCTVLVVVVVATTVAAVLFVALVWL